MDTCDNSLSKSDSTKAKINASLGSNGKSLRKCIRKGDVICFSKAENIKMLTGGRYVSHSSTRSSVDTSRQVDKILSGESLYKSFTFEQSSNNEDTEKCIAFWKSVMEKNLSPIKCTIIENKKNRQESVSLKVEPVEEDNNIEESIESRDHIEDVATQIHEEYKNIWKSALEEIQRKKLNEIKLIGEARCGICKTISSSPNEYSTKVNKAAVKKEIKELNNWQPTATGKQLGGKKEPNVKRLSDRSSSVSVTKKYSQSKKSEILSGSQRTAIMNVDEQVPVEKESSNTIPMPKILRESSSPKGVIQFQSETHVSLPSTKTAKEKPPPDNNDYKFTNIIDEKIKHNVYSDWRSNKIKTPCKCEFLECRCNTNPAIIKIEERKFENDESSCVEPDTCSISYNKEDNISFSSEMSYPIRSPQSSKSTKSKLGRTLSMLIPCACSMEYCDCLAKYEVASKTQVADLDWDKPEHVTHVEDYQERSSLELYKKKINRSNSGSLYNTCMEHLDDGESHDSSDITDIVPPSTYVKSVHHESMNSENLRGILSHENKKKSNKVMRSISIMLKNCDCDQDLCDCYEIEPLESASLPVAEVEDIPEALPQVKSEPIRRNSLELIRKRISSTMLVNVNTNRDDESTRDSVCSSITKGSINKYNLEDSVSPNERRSSGIMSQKIRKPKKNLSLAIRDCKCDSEDCDCVQIDTVVREIVEDTTIPKPPPSKMNLVKRDSLLSSFKRLSQRNLNLLSRTESINVIMPINSNYLSRPSSKSDGKFNQDTCSQGGDDDESCRFSI